MHVVLLFFVVVAIEKCPEVVGLAICPDRCLCTEEPEEPAAGLGDDRATASVWNVHRKNESSTIVDELLLMSEVGNVVSKAVEVNCRHRNITDIVATFKEARRRTVVFLDLGCNRIRSVKDGTFSGFSETLKLCSHLTKARFTLLATCRNLSNNLIEELEVNSFKGLARLRILDLTNNRLETIDQSRLKELSTLHTLLLSDNPIKTLPEGTFDVLPSLVQLGLRSDHLVCDCRVLWIVSWFQTASVVVENQTLCAAPVSIKGKLIWDIRDSDLPFDCNQNQLELAVFDLIPSTDQVVFNGDKMSVSCRVQLDLEDKSSSFSTKLSSTPNITWFLNDAMIGPPDNYTSLRRTVTVTTTTPSHSLSSLHRGQSQVMSTVEVHRLTDEEGGTWTCVVETELGRASKSISISVVSDHRPLSDGPGTLLHCPAILVDTDRGQYAWPRTVVGTTQRLPCAALGQRRSSIGADQPDRGSSMAFYQCVIPGRWINLDVGRCPFTSVYTNLLDELASVIRLDATSLNLKQLKALIGNGHKVTQPADVTLIADVIECVSSLTKNKTTVVDFIVSVSSALLNVDPLLLRNAQLANDALGRIVNALETVSLHLVGQSVETAFVSENIAIYVRPLSIERFNGITCFVVRHLHNLNETDLPGERRLTCVESSDRCPDKKQQSLQSLSPSFAEASIEIPAEFIRDPECTMSGCSEPPSHVTLVLISYKNARLFPVNDGNDSDLPTSVLSTSIVGLASERNATRVIIKMRSVPNKNVVQTPVYWEYGATDGRYGTWRSDGCAILSQRETLVTFTCSHLANVAILQTLKTPVSAYRLWFRGIILVNPMVHIGSAVLALSLVASIWLWLSNVRELDKKRRHLVYNGCSAMLVLCVVYSGGIRIVEPPVACWVVRCLVEYFSWSSLVWFTVALLRERRKLTSLAKSCRLHTITGDLTNATDGCHGDVEGVVELSMLGSSAICWGVPALIAGASGALQWNIPTSKLLLGISTVHPASLVMFYVPAALLVLFDTAACVQLCCFMHTVSILRRARVLSFTTDELERPPSNADARQKPLSPDRRHQHRSRIFEALNWKYPSIVSVVAISFGLVLGLSTWTLGAAAAAAAAASAATAASATSAVTIDAEDEYHGGERYEDIFGFLYLICSSSFGLLLLVFAVVLRSDGVHHTLPCRFDGLYRKGTVVETVNKCVNVDVALVSSGSGESLPLEHQGQHQRCRLDGHKYRVNTGFEARDCRAAVCRAVVNQSRRPLSVQPEDRKSNSCTSKKHAIARKDKPQSNVNAQDQVERSPKVPYHVFSTSIQRRERGQRVRYSHSQSPIMISPLLCSLPCRECSERLSSSMFSCSSYLPECNCTCRTLSRQSSRLHDFDHETVMNSADDEAQARDCESEIASLRTSTADDPSASRPAAIGSSCCDADDTSNRDVVFGGGRTGLPIIQPPPPSPCTDGSMRSSSISSPSYGSPKLVHRRRPTRRSSMRFFNVGEIDNNRHEPLSASGTTHVVGVSTWAVDSGIGRKSQNKLRTGHRGHHRSRRRLKPSMSPPLNPYDSHRRRPIGCRSVYDDISVQASRTPITDCPPPSPSSDYYRLHIWPGSGDRSSSSKYEDGDDVFEKQINDFEESSPLSGYKSTLYDVIPCDLRRF